MHASDDLAREQGRIRGYRFRLAELQDMLLEAVEIGLDELKTNDSARTFIERGLRAAHDGDMETALVFMHAAKAKLDG